jgi:hypothetical protein
MIFPKGNPTYYKGEGCSNHKKESCKESTGSTSAKTRNTHPSRQEEEPGGYGYPKADFS